MFSRRAAKAAAVCAAASAAAVASLAFSGVAAAQPAKGSNVAGAAAAVSPFTAGQTFDSGQKVNIVIPANSVLVSGTKVFILECAAPGGVNPTTIDECDGNTVNPYTVTANSDGSVNLQTQTGKLYPIYALPDHHTLGETSPVGATCGEGEANECVLYIGQGGGSDTGLSDPYFFSQPFQVHADSTDSGTIDPGDGTFPVDSAPAITSSSSTSFTEGSSGTFTVVDSGWPTPALSETGTLPTGVSFDSSTGVLSGTATQSGTFPVTFTASNAIGLDETPESVNQSFTLTVASSGPPPFEITTASLPNGQIGEPYNGGVGVALTESGAQPGATLKWKKVVVPKGLKVKAGVIEGTPSKKAPVGTNTIEVSLTEKYKIDKVKFEQTVTKSWTITISAAS